MALPGVSTLGVLFGYGAAGTTKPNAFTLLTRINSIGGIALETEQIDASALEDEISRYIAGRADTGGTVPITVNATDDTITEWEAVFAASQTAAEGGDAIWFEVWSPFHTKAFFFKAQTPPAFPMPEFEQNSLETVEIVLTVTEYKGLDTAVKPTA